MRHFGLDRFPPMWAVGISLSSEVTNIPNVPYLLYFFPPQASKLSVPAFLRAALFSTFYTSDCFPKPCF